MALTIPEAEQLYRQGEFGRLVAAFPAAEKNRRALSFPLRLMVARALVPAGRLDEAFSLATEDADSTPRDLQWLGEVVLGLICWRKGLLPAAAAHFRSAIHKAKDSTDRSAAGWAHVYAFRLAIDCQPVDSVMTLLAEVRQAVTRAGDPQVSAYLHFSVSVLEGQIGHLDESRRHCEIGESLLDVSPNAWIASNLALSRANIASLQCDFGNASRLIEIARTRISASENHRLKISLENSSAVIEMLTGDLSNARKRLSAIIRDPRAHQFDRLPQLALLARLHLISNELPECEEALEQLDPTSAKDVQAAPGHNLRWAGITRARLLLKQSRYQDAHSWLESLQRIDSTRDTRYTTVLCLLLAVTERGAGQNREAALSILRAEEQHVTESNELRGQYYFELSRLLTASIDLCAQLRHRALRTWNTQGLLLPRFESENAPVDADLCRQDVKFAWRKPPPDARTRECVADAIAAAFDVAHHPRMLGAELVSLIRGLECSPDVKVVETKHADPRELPGALSLQLGSLQNKALTLTCAAPTTPDGAVLLSNILRIGRAALALEKARQDERSRAALWPASPVEEQAGALYLAEEMQEVLATARRIATTNVPVLITGETGTGKEVLARTIHGYSPRSARTFLPFNCSATPREMLDAQLFGHRRGAFTGATENFSGIIRAAAGGTLFLDEIGETSLEVQPKLLRFLESGEVHPIGETHPVKADVRVIAATNADLDTLMAEGRFRQDLFYRLNIVRLHLPPLRERRVEIPALAHHYLQKYATECGKRDVRFAEETMEYLVLYRWPGNVRELANQMRRMAALAEDGAVLMPEHLSREIAASRRTLPPSERPLEATELVVRMDQPMSAAVNHVEQAMILYAMAKCGGHMEETAALLGLSRKGLYLKRQRLGLDVPPDPVGVVA